MEEFKKYLEHLSISKEINSSIINLFDQLCDFTERKLNNIENHALNDYSSSNNKLTVNSAIVSHKNIPYAETLGLYPFSKYRNEILNEKKSITLKKPVKPSNLLIHTFANCNYYEFLDLIDKNKKIYGTLYFENNLKEENVEFELKKSSVIIDSISEFKYWYGKNHGCEEPTIFAPFENRICELSLKTPEIFEEKKKQITKVVFYSLPEYLHFDYIPVWNISEQKQGNANEPQLQILPYLTEKYYTYSLKPKNQKTYLDVIAAVSIPDRINIISSVYNPETKRIEVITDTDDYFSETWNLYLINECSAQNNDEQLISYFTNQVSAEKDFLLQKMMYTDSVPSQALLQLCINRICEITHLLFDYAVYDNNIINVYVKNLSNNFFEHESVIFLQHYLNNCYKKCMFLVKGAD